MLPEMLVALAVTLVVARGFFDYLITALLASQTSPPQL